MKIEQSFEEFCSRWYAKAMQVADITITRIENKNGRIMEAIDLESVKVVGVTYALEKTYNNYDVDNARHASVETFLSTVVRNCVITELGKETTAVERAHVAFKPKREKYSRKYSAIMPGIAQSGSTGEKFEAHDYMKASDYSERKEKVKKEEKEKLIDLLKKLPAIDQVILANWMEEERTYIEKSLEVLGLEDNKRNRDMLSLRRNRALKTLKGMFGGKRADYRDIYIPSGSLRDLDGMEAEYSGIERADRNFERRRERAAKAYITRQIDYGSFSESDYRKLIEE